jgi:type IV pilus assembly protein PilQ
MNAKSIVSLSLCTLMVLQGLVSCMHRSSSPSMKPPITALDRVSVTESADRLRIEVEGGRPMTYSLATQASPASVTVDVPGFSRGTQAERLIINKGPVLDLTAQDVSAPNPGVQLVFALAAAAEPDIHAEGTRLVIDFPKSHGAGSAESHGMSEPLNAHVQIADSGAVSEDSVLQASPAKTLTRIDVQKSDTTATITIVADGDLTYEAKRSSGDRLVLDVANVTSSLHSKLLAVSHPSIRRVRIGQHAKKVRLVFDLAGQATYSIKPEGHQLAVQLALPAESETSVTDAPGRTSQPFLGAEKKSIDQAIVRTAASGSVPFPERLAMIQARPSLAQMAPEQRSGKELDTEDIGQRRYAGRRISLDFQMADISNVLRLIAEVSGFNIVVGEGVKSKVTMKLVGVPWDQALDMLLKMNNLGMIREGNIVWIDSLSNIAKQQDEEARAKESKTKAEDLVTRVIYIQNIAATELQTTLRQYLSPRGQLTVNQASNALVIQDTESRVGSFAELVRSLDLQVPQVQIEARIVQADTSYSRSLGVQWGISNTAASNGGSSFFGNPTGGFSEQQLDTKGTITRSFLVNLPAAVSGLSSVPAAGFTFGKIGTRDGFSLDLRLSAGELLGLTKVIAAPKITTLDKREAKISQGESIPFQTTSLQGTQTTFVDANLELQVTPQITSRDPKEPNKQVLLKIRATRNAVGARSNPAGPSIDKREATTQVLVVDGETMVIGGIFVDSQTNTVAGLPYLSRIPVLGWLFKNKTESVSKQELLIFLTPSIVKTT